MHLFWVYTSLNHLNGLSNFHMQSILPLNLGGRVTEVRCGCDVFFVGAVRGICVCLKISLPSTRSGCSPPSPAALRASEEFFAKTGTVFPPL